MTDAAAGNGRLDRIEAKLKTASEILIRVASRRRTDIFLTARLERTRQMAETDPSNGGIRERLDFVENDLETVKQTLVLVASLVESNRESIDELTDRLDQLTVRVDRLAVSQENTQATVDRLVESQQTTQAEISQLTGTVNQLAQLVIQSIESANADRAVMREMQLEVRGIQTENRRILDHLFGSEDEQQDNGG